jgi:lipoic acid synthetase
MGLTYVVITSVTRDELDDGGASVWAETIRQVRKALPQSRIETLVPDFKGRRESIEQVLCARPDVFNHNLESVPRLYPQVRPQAKYKRSLELLEYAKKQDFVTKSSLMLGLGEEAHELESLLKDLVEIGVDILTLGQYLQPTPFHLPVQRFVSPSEFDEWRIRALAMGIKTVTSGPLVRSSYHADEQWKR